MPLGFLIVRRVEVLTLAEILLHPCQRPLVLLDVIDLLVHAAGELTHVDVFVAHAQVLGPELILDHGTRDAHRDRTHGQVGAPLHLGYGEAADGVVEQPLPHLVGDGLVVGVLHVLAVDAEGGDAQLGVAGERGGQVDRAGPLRTVEAPDGVWDGAIHVDGLGSVCPTGGHGQREADVLTAELLGGGLRLGHPTDRGVGYDTLNGVAVNVAQLRLIQGGNALCHVHGLVLEALADPAAPTIDDGADTDLRMVRHGLFLDVDCGYRA